MTFSLNTKIVYPDNVNEIKNAIIYTFFLCYFIFFIILFNLFTLTVKFDPLKVGIVK